MALTITFQNVEKLVFQDSVLKQKLSDYNTLFQTYALASQSSDLRPVKQKTLIDFVNNFKDDHLKILTDHFNQEVSVQKIDINVAHHYDFHVDEIESKLNEMRILKEFYFAYREGDQVYLSTWR